ncbi:hypothetical protein ACFPIF_11720 [Brevundimonas faecalis]|uniref:hypothetical protein n=1 Tax=Brevundimonas faecalis TaxID=947378 RepID=UPI0036210987
MTGLPVEADAALASLVSVWRCGEAGRLDPVLISMQARATAELHRIAPGAAIKARQAYASLIGRAS